jgi:hypothetical protein
MSDLSRTIVARHGEESAVVIDITEFHRLCDDIPDFKDFLRSGPDLEDLDLPRSRELPREIDLGDSELTAA